MKTTIINGTMPQEEYWSITPTPTLRWVERAEEINGVVMEVNILQQMWQGSKGSIKWEDVPTIKEEEIR